MYFIVPVLYLAIICTKFRQNYASFRICESLPKSKQLYTRTEKQFNLLYSIAAYTYFVSFLHRFKVLQWNLTISTFAKVFANIANDSRKMQNSLQRTQIEGIYLI
jgi:hypothetical protein